VRRDPGLQPERTDLAWRRTLLSVTVVAALAVRLALAHGAGGALVAGLAMAGWIAVVVVTHRRMGAMVSPAPYAAGRVLPLLALATVGYAVLGVLLVLLGLA